MDDRKHREVPPQETIRRVRAILDEIGVGLYEKRWNDVDQSLFSVSLGISRFSIPSRHRAFGSNGKGVSVEFALASAHAEFLERLQNLHPTCFFNSFGEMPGAVKPADAKLFRLDSLQQITPEALRRLFSPEALDALSSRTLTCLPFYGIDYDSVTWLPEQALSAVCESNGMCAGNTAEEALVYGISEICERYVAREIFKNRLETPVIPSSDLQRLSSIRLLRAVERHGYRVIVKDCTLGGRYPVLGVVLVDPLKSAYHVHFGANPCMDIALERCLTEAFQGVSVDSNARLKLLLWDDSAFDAPAEGNGGGSLRGRIAWRDFVQAGMGEIPTTLLVSNGVPRHQPAFETVHRGSRESLMFLLGLMKKSGHGLFVRDVSFLGFPAFRIYSPGISELYEPLDETLFELLTERLPRARSTLLSLKSADDEDIRECAEIIEDLLAEPRFPALTLIPRICQIAVAPNADFAALYDANFLLQLLYQRLGDRGKAASFLRRHLFDPTSMLRANGGNKADMEYFSTALALHHLTASGLEESEASRTVATLLGEKPTRRAADELNKPREAFNRFKLPRCGDCEDCEIMPDCQYPSWRAIAERISDEISSRPIDQETLREIFLKRR